MYPVTLAYLQTIHQVIVHRLRTNLPSSPAILSAEEWDKVIRENHEADTMMQYLFEMYDWYWSTECRTDADFQEARDWLLRQVDRYLFADTVVRQAMHPFQSLEDYLDQRMNAVIDMHAMSKPEYHKAMQDWENELSRNRLQRTYEIQERRKIMRNTIVHACMIPVSAVTYLDVTPLYEYVAHLPPNTASPTRSHTTTRTRIQRERVAVAYLTRCVSPNG